MYNRIPAFGKSGISRISLLSCCSVIGRFSSEEGGRTLVCPHHGQTKVRPTSALFQEVGTVDVNDSSDLNFSNRYGSRGRVLSPADRSLRCPRPRQARGRSRGPF